jgi:hypothetical protein
VENWTGTFHDLVVMGSVNWTWLDGESVMLTCDVLGVEYVGKNRGLGWWVEPCSASEPRPLFLLLVSSQQTVK